MALILVPHHPLVNHIATEVQLLFLRSVYELHSATSSNKGIKKSEFDLSLLNQVINSFRSQLIKIMIQNFWQSIKVLIFPKIFLKLTFLNPCKFWSTLPVTLTGYKTCLYLLDHHTLFHFISIYRRLKLRN